MISGDGDYYHLSRHDGADDFGHYYDDFCGDRHQLHTLTTSKKQ
ncbi:hypothetical protein [Kluyvera intermedia]